MGSHVGIFSIRWICRAYVRHFAQAGSRNPARARGQQQWGWETILRPRARTRAVFPVETRACRVSATSLLGEARRGGKHRLYGRGHQAGRVGAVNTKKWFFFCAGVSGVLWRGEDYGGWLRVFG